MKVIYGMIAFAWYGFLSNGFAAHDSVATFNLRMTQPQVQKICPKPLISMYDMLHDGKYFACDDGQNTTVLVFTKEKLVAIMDLKYFAKLNP